MVSRGSESSAPRLVGVMIRILNGKTDMSDVDVSKEHLKNLARSALFYFGWLGIWRLPFFIYVG